MSRAGDRVARDRANRARRERRANIKAAWFERVTGASPAVADELTAAQVWALVVAERNPGPSAQYIKAHPEAEADAPREISVYAGTSIETLRSLVAKGLMDAPPAPRHACDPYASIYRLTPTGRAWAQRLEELLAATRPE